MRVRLIPENVIVDAYLPISSLDNLLVKYEDESIIKEKGARWETRSRDSYQIIEVHEHEQRFINRNRFK